MILVTGWSHSKMVTGIKAPLAQTSPDTGAFATWPPKRQRLVNYRKGDRSGHLPEP